jgi:RHS repeat-associated protein
VVCLPRFRAEVSSQVKKICAGVDGSYERYGSSYTVTFNLPEGVNERTYAVKLKVRDNDRQYGYKTVYVTVKRPKHFYFYVKDHLGSTRAVVDEAGDVVEAYDYYPFGLQSRSYKEKGDPLTKETFTGKEQDTESNLHYFGARYYDAGAGRWLSVDPLAHQFPGMSSYLYSFNSPANFLDPDGKAAFAQLEFRVAGGPMHWSVGMTSSVAVGLMYDGKSLTLYFAGSLGLSGGLGFSAGLSAGYILNTNNEEALGPGFAAGWFNGLIGLFTKQRGYEVNFPIGELPDGSYGPVSMGATVSTRLSYAQGAAIYAEFTFGIELEELATMDANELINTIVNEIIKQGITENVDTAVSYTELLLENLYLNIELEKKAKQAMKSVIRDKNKSIEPVTGAEIYLTEEAVE